MGCSQVRQIKRFAKSATFVSVLLILGLTSTLILNFPANVSRMKRPVVTNSITEDGPLVGQSQRSKNINSHGGPHQRMSATNNSVSSLADRSDVSTVSNASHPITTTPTESSLLLTITHHLGRLGNRMFEYAAVLGLGKQTGRRAFVNPYKTRPDLTSLFQLTRVEERSVDGSWAKVQETKYAYFDPIFKSLPDQNVKITGYVQSWKYFDKIRNTIRKEFTLLPSIRADVDRRKQDILLRVNVTDPVFVGVHVRQKDKESTPNTLEAPKSFFTNAMDKMRSLLKGFDVIFLVAGNNHKWCLDNFKETDVVVLPPLEPEIHFALLSSCQHGIVFVGSFGWWTAWLTCGQVIFYKKFPASNTFEYKGFVYEDYYPPHWIPVDD